RDSQPRGALVLLQPHAQPSIVAIDAIARHPGCRHPCVESVLEHLACPLRLRGKRVLLEYTSALTALAVVRPRLRHIECTISQGMALPTGIGQKHPNLAMLHPASRPTILARHPSRLLPFFEKPSFSEDHDSLRVAQMLDHIG